jgi:hypothetical protein
MELRAERRRTKAQEEEARRRKKGQTKDCHGLPL